MTSPDWFLIGKILFNIYVSCKLSCNECNECLKPGCFQVNGGPGGAWRGLGAETKTRDRRENGAETVPNTLSDN